MRIHRNTALFSLMLSIVSATCTPDVRAEESEFEKWKREQQQDFQDFQTREDKAFIAFLRKEWQEFQIFKGNVRDITPKPALPPSVRNSVDVSGSGAAPGLIRTGRKHAVQSRDANQFYGNTVQPLQFPVTRIPALDQLSSESISAAWSTLSAADHRATLAALTQYQKNLGLGDWALIRLADQLLQQQFPQQNQRNCYLWFVLVKMGFNVKLGYTADKLVLLLPSSNKLYGIRYSVIDNTSYYMQPEPADEMVFSYSGGEYKPDQAAFDFTLKKLINPTRQTDNIEVKYSYNGNTLALRLKYDAGLSEFLVNYPQIDLPGYFSSHPSPVTAESLHKQLAPLIKDMDARQALNFLLGFTQRLFQYQTDQDQFGREKYLVVEESLYYGINDCEDRSIFLAWLIKDLLGLEQVVLDYPGHIALAVRTGVMPDDDTVEYQGTKYVVMDPTYIGASIGRSMPSVAKLKPAIIAVNY